MKTKKREQKSEKVKVIGTKNVGNYFKEGEEYLVTKEKADVLCKKDFAKMASKAVKK